MERVDAVGRGRIRRKCLGRGGVGRGGQEGSVAGRARGGVLGNDDGGYRVDVGGLRS